MTTRIEFPKATRRDDPRVLDVIRQAEVQLTGAWGRLNPYWLERAFIRVEWRGAFYRAQLLYTSDQGTGHVASFWSN